jgi:hypothetical protein
MTAFSVSSIIDPITDPIHDKAKLADELHYVMNTLQLQTTRHLKFWEAYFLDANRRPTFMSTL